MKKMWKRVLAVVMAVLMLTVPALAAGEALYTQEADALNSLGLFQGTNNGYELDRAPNRAEALVMLIRLLGKEADALAYEGSCPLTDVAGRWMAPYVGWAYANGITEGVTDDTFDPNGTANAKMFCTFVLRALGYSDAAGDFAYAEAVAKAIEVGIAPAEGYADGEFVRDDCVHICYLALTAQLKDGAQTLVDKLVADGAVDAGAADALNLRAPAVVEPEPEPDPEPAAPSNVAYVTVSVDGKLELIAQPVEVAEGATAETVLKAAHAQYCAEGEDGFASGIDSMYNMYMISKVWGVTGNPGVIVNGLVVGGDMSLPMTADLFPVAAGDNVIVTISSDSMNNPPLYVALGTDGTTVKATMWSLDFMTWQWKPAAYSGANVLDAITGEALGTTDANGCLDVSGVDVVAVDGWAAIPLNVPTNSGL